MSDNLTAVIIVMVVILGPVWITFHYGTKRKAVQQMNAQDAAAFAQLTQTASRMEQRIATLERILDTEAPNWRQTAQMGAPYERPLG